MRLTILLALLVLAASPASAQTGTPGELGAGAGWIDYDDDGDLDLFVLSAFGSISLFAYDGSTFIDVSQSALPAGILQNVAPAMGVTCGDIDGDGWPDAVLTTERRNFLLMNNGDGTFRSVGRAAGLLGEDLSSSVGLIDHDSDGDLDIYIANYEGKANQFFRNDGSGDDGTPRLVDVAPALGLDFGEGNAGSWSLGVAVGDYDNDGDADLYVANDYDGLDPFGDLRPGPNILYRNEGDGTFSDVSASSGADDAGWAMGTAFGDYDGDGDLDLFVANFWEDALLRNEGNGTFVDVAGESGLLRNPPAPGDPENPDDYNSFGAAFVDFDNDGDLDIAVVNGFILNDRSQVDCEPNELWENLGPAGAGGSGPWRFREIGKRAGIADTGDGRGGAFADFDRDGFVDFLAVNTDFITDDCGAPAPVRLLYVNQADGTFEDRAGSLGLRASPPDAPGAAAYRDLSGNRWIQVRPVGTVSNRSAVGARVEVFAGGRRWIQDVGAASYCSSNSPYLHFGLGEITGIDSVAVRFPSGRRLVTASLQPDQFLDLVEPESTPVRLLAFGAESGPEGVRLRWAWTDDGDAAGFALSRHAGGVTRRIAPWVGPSGGSAEFLDREAPRGRLTYSLTAILRDGTREALGSASVVHGGTVEPPAGPAVPNPFRAGVWIPVRAVEAGGGAVTIVDAAGRQVRRLDFTASRGSDGVRWDGRDDRGSEVPPGVYFYRIAGDGPFPAMKLVRRP